MEKQEKQNNKVIVGSPTYLKFHQGLKNGKLTHLIMDLPFGCNHNCPKCYRKENVSIEDLDLEFRKKIIKQANELGVKAMYIAGEGEPLFHKNAIIELVKHNNSLDMITILYTNGSLLDEETAQFMFDNNVILIISVDSFNPETYRELTGGGDFNRLQKNIEIAKKIYSKGINIRSDGTIETKLGIITIVSQQNMHEIQDIKKFCGDEIYFICNFPIKEGNAIKNWDKLVGNKLNDLIEISHKFTDTGFGGLSAPLSNGRCIALYNSLTIDTNGNILACPASVKSRIGNIKEESIKDLLIKQRQHIEDQGNPLCIARDIKDQIFRHHDGNIAKHL